MHIPAPNDIIRRDLPDAAIHSPTTRRAERQAKRGRLSLALQGGGSFGAFTWGVLDRLLEEEDLIPTAFISDRRAPSRGGRLR